MALTMASRRPPILAGMVALFVAAPSAESQETPTYSNPAPLVVAEGPSAVELSIRTYSAGGATQSASLDGIALLDLELTGRTQVDRLDRSRPRRVAVPGAPAHLELPGGARVFRFRRAVPPAQGLFAVDPSGTVRILFELPEGSDDGGVGEADPDDPDDGPVAEPYVPRDSDPFSSMVAASPDGLWLAVATEEPAGGGIRLVAVDGTLETSLTPGGGVEVDPTSMTFAAGALFATVDGDWIGRAPIPAGPFVSLPLPPSGGDVPSWVAPEIAVSRDGSRVAFVAGDDPDEVDVYVAGPSEPAVNVTQASDRYRAPGFAPSTSNGPMLALAEDGSRVAFLRRLYGGLYPVGYTAEEDDVLVAPTTSAGGAQAKLLTGDANFHPWIGTGIILGVRLGTVTWGFAGHSGSFDFFRAHDFGPTGYSSVVVNLSQTGSLRPPFQDVASIVPLDTVRIPGSDARLVTDGGSASGLRLVDPLNPIDGPISAAPQLLAASLPNGSLPYVSPVQGIGSSLFLASAGPDGIAHIAEPVTLIGPAPTHLASSESLPIVVLALSEVPGAANRVPGVLSIDLGASQSATTLLPAGSSIEALDVGPGGEPRLVLRQGTVASAWVLGGGAAPLLASGGAAVVHILR